MAVVGGSCRKFLACNVYVSAGGLRRHGPILMDLLKETQDSCSQTNTTTQNNAFDKNNEVCVVVHAFSDAVYNRSSFHLAGSEGMLASVVSDLVKKAQRRLREDKEKEQDSSSSSEPVVHHPYVGLVDHVSVMPLNPQSNKFSATSVKSSAISDNFVPLTGWGRAARTIGKSMEQSDTGTQVFYYGSADPCNTPLSTVRRTKTQFFKSGGLDDLPASSSKTSVIQTNTEDYLRNAPRKSLDTATVGAPFEFVENFNIRLTKNCTRQMAQSLTRWVRERDGGLPGVEALTLPYSNGQFETACNLLQPQIGSAEAIQGRVQEWVSRMANDDGNIEGDMEYFVEKTYRVGTTVKECLSVLDLAFQPGFNDNFALEEHNIQVQSQLTGFTRVSQPPKPRSGSTGLRASSSLAASALPTFGTGTPCRSSTIAGIGSTSMHSFSVQQQNVQIQTRGFAIKRSKKQPGGGKGKQQREALPLMNEYLVKELMKRNRNATSPDQVQLRLVIEEGGEGGKGGPPKSEETSLAKAIQTSLDLGLDLVEIDLNNPSLPVVRAVQYDAKVYRINKEKSKKQIKDPASIVKEFRFRARTADHDMERKLAAVLDALKKGHKCQIQATCPARLINTGVCPTGAAEVMDRVLATVGSEGDTLRAPEVNLAKTVSSVQLLPRKAGKN